MTDDDCRERLTQFLDAGRPDLDYPAAWNGLHPLIATLKDGACLATFLELATQGVVLSNDREPIPFYGALGKLVPLLGLPESREYILGSSGHGRYQLYAKGLGIWEGDPDHTQDLGYPVARWDPGSSRTRKCAALIAFFDLRGFTQWSAPRDAACVQRVIETLERSFQASFLQKWSKRLFAKGTGDGFMVISEAQWYQKDAARSGKTFHTGHAADFCRACAQTIQDAQDRIPKELAIGCGVTCGELTQLYMLGRYDYIGPKVNDASKIQAVAYNELCISLEVVDLLRQENINLVGKYLPGKALRISPDVFSTERTNAHEDQGT